MKCHYEVLEVPRDAQTDEIKKARDRLAKKYHPDKALQSNDPSLVQEFTAKFRLIQQAYEVLSDSHERSWYDSHREQILSSKSVVQQDLDIFAFFNSTCYSGFADDEKGFYTIYRNIFAKISEQDIKYAEDAKEEYQVPSFGISSSSYEEIVNPFYGFWQSYTTKRPFYSLDKWDLRTADNRRICRAMEKENKKVRDAAKKEWNESVRELVSFVRKRDPRVKAYRKILEERAQESRNKVFELQEQQRKTRQDLLSSHVVDHSHDHDLERKYRELENSFGKDSEDEVEELGPEEPLNEGEEVVEVDDEDDDPLYCLSCEKRFKSFPAMRNHVQSKQHKKNMELLRDELLREHETVDHLVGAVESLEVAEDDEVLASHVSCAEETVETVVLEAEEPVETVILAEDPEKIEVDEYRSRNKAKKEKKSKQTKQKTEELGLRCGVCNSVFTTRNKLFQHIKESGHAVLK